MDTCEWCGRSDETIQRHAKISHSRAVGYVHSYKLSRPALLCFQCSVGRYDSGKRAESIYWEPQVVKRMVAENFLLFAYSHRADFPTGTAETGGYHVLVTQKVYATLRRVVQLAKDIYAAGGNDLDMVALLKETWESENGGGADATPDSVGLRSGDRGDLSRSDGVEASLAFAGGAEVDSPDREAGD